jgi:hypothetical protein
VSVSCETVSGCCWQFVPGSLYVQKLMRKGLAVGCVRNPASFPQEGRTDVVCEPQTIGAWVSKFTVKPASDRACMRASCHFPWRKRERDVCCTAMFCRVLSPARS